MGIGKSGSSSWLTTVKRAFRSPTKGSAKKACKRSEDRAREEDEDEKKTEKRRWIFRKLTSPTKRQREASVSGHEERREKVKEDEQRRALEVAEASTEVAKVAVEKAQAAVKNAKQGRLAVLVRQHYAALVIQTAFRGYLARQAFRALKGIVQLQALVRGHNVRKQAKAALKCMQALIRVQAKMQNRCSKALQDGTRKSMFAESYNLWDKYKDIRQRTPVTLDEGAGVDEWEDRPYTIEDIEAMLKSKKEEALKREKALAYALSQQIRRPDRNEVAINENEPNEITEWLGQWIESEQTWVKDKRSMSQRRHYSIKDADIESVHAPQSRRHSLHVASPLNYGSAYHYQSPLTPSFSNSRPLHSASPRRSHSTTTTPSLRSNCPSTVSSYRYRATGAMTMPNYMAATESAKAKARSQSTPKHRSSTPERSERGGSVKKRLSYSIPESHSDCTIYNSHSCFSENLRSPSFRSVQGGGFGMDIGSFCSCYTESTGGEISPASTSQLKRWLN